MLEQVIEKNPTIGLDAALEIFVHVARNESLSAIAGYLDFLCEKAGENPKSFYDISRTLNKSLSAYISEKDEFDAFSQSFNALYAKYAAACLADKRNNVEFVVPLSILGGMYLPSRVVSFALAIEPYYSKGLNLFFYTNLVSEEGRRSIKQGIATVYDFVESPSDMLLSLLAGLAREADVAISFDVSGVRN